ncbi:MAG: hypothetical protein JNM56_19210 [Planctomycetia bacterium]|nr:hypothetical protein [Planctomycetia bacterium]
MAVNAGRHRVPSPAGCPWIVGPVRIAAYLERRGRLNRKRDSRTWPRQVLLTAPRSKEYLEIYREFFDVAEKRRRWSLRDDIPWDQCNPKLDPAVACVVESFSARELGKSFCIPT